VKQPPAKDRRQGSAARGLTLDEAALWARVAQTVTPLAGRRAEALQSEGAPGTPAPPRRPAARVLSPPSAPVRIPQGHRSPERPLDRNSLDSTWDRRLARGMLAPDFTLDLHGCTLDAAHARLDHGLMLATAQGARLVLLVTGRLRPSEDHAGRGERRGAIRAKFLDWLASGPHASQIAAVRPAHPRHGGAGAVYIVLRRPR